MYFKFRFFCMLTLIVFSVSPLSADERSEKLDLEFKQMLTSIESDCENYEGYRPYKSAIKALNEQKSVSEIPSYTYGSIFGSDFLHFNNTSDCRPTVINFIIKGVEWLQDNEIVKPTEAFWASIRRGQAEALVKSFYLTGDIELLNKAVHILRQDYLEHYNLDQYKKLKENKKTGLKKNSEKSNFDYYDPRSYYLATMIFPPEIGVDVPADYLEILLEKTQEFENSLIDKVDEPFDNYESATLNVFAELLRTYKNDEIKYQYWSGRIKNHILSLKERDYKTHDSCGHLNRFSRLLNIPKTSYKQQILTWLQKFYQDNCNIIKPLEEFVEALISRYPKKLIDQSGKLQGEVLRHATNDLWRYAGRSGNTKLCEALKTTAKNNENVVSKIIADETNWKKFESTFCK